MIAVDSSALVTIALRESGHVSLASVFLDEACAIAAPVLLACHGALRRRGVGEGDAAGFCQWIRALPNVTVLSFDEELLGWAQLGCDRFGDAAGSGSGLSTTECMSYAVAKHLNAELLFTDGVFRRTDLKIHPSSRP